MGGPKFTRPKYGKEDVESPNLFVANCGPAVGIQYDAIASVFGFFGEVTGVYPADESGVRVIVSYKGTGPAMAAMNALHGRSCALLGGRSLYIRPSVIASPVKVHESVPVAMSGAELNIPGLKLVHDFVSESEEQELLAAVDKNQWKILSKRRVQHYGYEFIYDSRNVDTNQYMGELPKFLSLITERIRSIPDLHDPECSPLDQLTVNEYLPGVGLSPHIDTHSAFEGSIYSLSLAGTCIMEFRRYPDSSCYPTSTSANDTDSLTFVRKAVFLPPRSMLLLSSEARYAWHHYIPHHKIDKINDSEIRRCSRRVSFTLRKVRKGPCQCEFPQYCDSQR